MSKARKLITLLFLIPVMAIASETYPDSKLTPGAVDPAATEKKICEHGYTAKVRHVTVAMKKQVFARYGIAYQPGDYEVDHFVSLELGGSNVIENLWPEPYCPIKTGGVSCFGAREKDVVETSLHRRICSGEISLKDAQRIIRTDWLKEYKRIKATE